jgi:uncharacterized protein YacL
MNTDRLLKLAFPYIVILILDALTGYIVFYGEYILLNVGYLEYDSLPRILTSNVGLIFQLMVMILLFRDLRKHSMRYYLIPVAGFLFPLLGIVMFLLVMMSREQPSTDVQKN